MRKITLLLMITFVVQAANAQFTYTTIKSDGFETTDGLPATFTRTGQALWSTATAPYTGGFWDLVFASTTPKDYIASAYTADFHSGAQCLKITTGTSTVALRLRSVTDLPFASTIVEWTKYKVSVWAKGTAGTQIFDKITTLATGNWDKYEFTTNYSVGTSDTKLMLDLKATAGTSATIYLDDILVEKYNQVDPVTNAATGVSQTGFTANWTSVPGATGYTLYVQQSTDNGVNYTGTAPGTPITITSGATTTYDVTGLTSNTYYRYKIVATDGTYLSPSSNYTNITTSTTTGLENTLIKSIIVENNKIRVNTNEGQLISVFSCAGQKIYGEISKTGLNEITINSRGIYVIKVGNESRKIIL